MVMKMHEMWDSVFEELEFRFPYIYSNAVHWYPVGRNHILVRTEDRNEWIYDWENKILRRKNMYVGEDAYIDEQEWREQFGNKLRSMMWFKGISLYELSRLSGISEVSLSKYLNGRATPSAFNLECINRALDCSILELTYFEY